MYTLISQHMNLISWRGTPRGAEGAGRCKYEITGSCLQQVLETGLGSWRPGERKHPSCLWERQEEGSGETQAGPATILEDCPKLIKEKIWLKTATINVWIYKRETIPEDCLVPWDSWLDGSRESSDYCLSWLWQGFQHCFLIDTQLHKSLSDSEDLQVEAEKYCYNSVNKAEISCLHQGALYLHCHKSISFCSLFIHFENQFLISCKSEKKSIRNFGNLKSPTS